jgi:isoleucyl-tRNA synthetase
LEKNITYVKVRTFNPYTGKPVTLILAKERFSTYFPESNSEISLNAYRDGDKEVPFKVLSEYKGSELKNIEYEQLLSWIDPGEGAFRVVLGDFVTTEDGTGIVHIAPTFGADDYRVGLENGIPPLTVIDKNGFISPLVDKKGRFIPLEDIDPAFLKEKVKVDEYKEFAGRYVKK